MKHYILIDEFQEVIAGSRNVGPVYKQARDRDMSIIGFLQLYTDLNQHPVRMASSVLGNVAFEITFSAKDDEGMKHLINTSGLVKKKRKTETITSGGKGSWFSVSFQEYEDTAINIEDIHRLNNTPGMAVLNLARDGFGSFYRPTFIHMDFITSDNQEFKRLQALPWPSPKDWKAPSEAESEAAEESVEETDAQFEDILKQLDSL